MRAIASTITMNEVTEDDMYTMFCGIFIEVTGESFFEHVIGDACAERTNKLEEAIHGEFTRKLRFQYEDDVLDERDALLFALADHDEF